MQSTQVLPPWWDRETDDDSGQPLRTDVRESAQRVWKFLWLRTRHALGDAADAPELMESTVKIVSRYLDKQAVPPFSANLDGLLSLSFQRSLLRQARRRRRWELIGGSTELEVFLQAPDWSEQVDRRLLLEQLACEMSPVSRTILRLRISGHSWKDVGRILEIESAAARKTFWRDIRKAQLGLVKSREFRKRT
jgi:hypothetical protein